MNSIKQALTPTVFQHEQNPSSPTSRNTSTLMHSQSQPQTEALEQSTVSPDSKTSDEIVERMSKETENRKDGAPFAAATGLEGQMDGK
ncbi:uncharacterized protein PAC_12311 [Phialocephala subalpina]|uniref:Uncharacterized protein n=1 Tax=Phialocephala subalpina TaxID=576137 RepID=A0A1L7XBK7_9HELO|nr:uncharacterized protein PAC_12311 [Phialocephala subalpina]